MKKGLLLGALLLGAGAVSAQSLYVGLQGGYGFATPSDAVGTATVVTTAGLTETNNYSSFGGGTNLGLNVGYMVTEHFGAELGFSYFLGSSVTVTDVTVPTGLTTTGQLTVMAKSTQMRLTPSLIVSTGGDFAVYAKAGLVLPVGGSTMAEYVDNTDPLIATERDFESKGALSLGYQGAIGVDYKLSDNLSIFGELSGINLRIKSATNTMTRNEIGGVDFLPLTPNSVINTVYVDELSPTSNNGNYNPDFDPVTAPNTEELASTANFNALFINLGVKYSF